MRLADGDTVSPQWENACPFDQVCDAGAAALSGGANIQTNHAAYQSIAGFIAGLGQGSGSATWTVLGAPAGQAVVSVRYANYVGALGGPAPRTIDLTVNGADVKTLTLPPTSSWDDWNTVTATVPLSAGPNTVGLLCAPGDSCTVNVDTLSVAPAGAPAPAQPDLHYLGGYTRGFDTATYGPGYSCPAGTPTAAQCTAALPEMHPGILDQAGYRLVDDSQSAVWSGNGWVAPRAGGDVQDGYLFVYGHDYQQALADLNRLSGDSPLLPEYTFGVWFSRYYAYSVSDYENTLFQAFRANHVPLDTLSVDTNWKSPNDWDGWEWNPSLFPDPAGFLSWAAAQGIHVTLNIHASIQDSDPQLAATEALAGNSLADNTCFSGACKVWDWSSVPQAESYFALHQPFESQGVSFWWLDWCCDSSTASNPGVTPDSWINHLYAQEMANKNERGFVLSRTGSSYQNPDEVYPAGPWSGHTSTLAFTGDTWGTWNTLAFQVQLAADESSIDEPYVSDDIGSFLGPPPGSANNPADASDDPDVYARWVQLGTFQPILRLHSSAGNRLPWDYPQPADGVAASFLRLREALVPYTYTLADESVRTGLPINRPLYLDYPDEPAAYANPGEYLYGPDVLVAPVTTPGTVATESVWFPPGQWTDWFTGATFTGPSEQTLTVPLDRMPVFVKAGGIVPEQAPMSHVGAKPDAPTTLRVYPGDAGQFSLYADAGDGTGYQRGQYSLHANRLLVLARPGPGHPREHRPRRRPLPGGAEQPELLGPPRAPDSAGRRARRRASPAGVGLAIRLRHRHRNRAGQWSAAARQRADHGPGREADHLGRAGRGRAQRRSVHAAQPVRRWVHHGDDDRARRRSGRRPRSVGGAERTGRLDGHAGLSGIRRRSGGRTVGHPVLDGDRAVGVDLAGDRNADRHRVLPERRPGGAGDREPAGPAHAGAASATDDHLDLAGQPRPRRRGHPDRPELRREPGLELSDAGPGRDELGSALRRREADDHELERGLDHVRPAAGQRAVPARARPGDDHGHGGGRDLGRPDAEHRRDGGARAFDHRGVALEHAAGEHGHAHRAELRSLPGVELPDAGPGQYELGGAVRRREADDQQLE